MDRQQLQEFLTALPKAELHLHLEGSMEPETVAELAARHGVAIQPEEVAARYRPGKFDEFLEAFKWVTSFIRDPADYALIARRLAEQLLSQNVIYAELTLSAGVMLRRNQDVEANFAAIREEAAQARARGLRVRWVFDATRQFGAKAAMDVARLAARCRPGGVVAFGMGGDELSVATEEFRGVYQFAAENGLHRLVHAGEIGGAESVLEAIDLLGAERIGHGIAVLRDARAVDFVAARQIPLEICPTSNLRTGALAGQLRKTAARIEEHPLRQFFARGVPVVLSTDDPAMFQTDLVTEYLNAARMGLSAAQLAQIAEASFDHAFLPEEEKRALLQSFHFAENQIRLL